MGTEKDKSVYQASITFDDDTIRRMFRAEYFTYERMQLLTRIAIGAVLILLGVLTNLPLGAKAIAMMIGVWLVVSLDFPSKVRAETVLQARGGQKSQVSYLFDMKKIAIENGPEYAYSQVDRVVEDKEYFFVFMDRQTAVMIPKDKLKPANADAFRSFLEEKTGKHAGTEMNLLTMNLKDVHQMMKDRIGAFTKH